MTRRPWIDPEIDLALASVPGPFATLESLTDANLPALRAQWKGMFGATELSEQVERVDRAVPGIDGAPDVPVRIHRPRGQRGLLPCVLSIHAGGYVFGTYEMDDARFDRWCIDLGCIGVAVDYRLAPETQYPGALHDCYATLLWLHRHAGALGVDASRIGISGVSAGGGLAAGLALMARDREEVPIAFQLLVAPMLDDRQQTVSSQWVTPVWTASSNAYGWRSYLGTLYGSDAVPATAAPARAKDLSALPPTFLSVGSADGFCDEDVAYAQRLIRANVPTELHVYVGAPHGFAGVAPRAQVTRRSNRDVIEWLRGALA